MNIEARLLLRGEHLLVELRNEHGVTRMAKAELGDKIEGQAYVYTVNCRRFVGPKDTITIINQGLKRQLKADIRFETGV